MTRQESCLQSDLVYMKLIRKSAAVQKKMSRDFFIHSVRDFFIRSVRERIDCIDRQGRCGGQGQGKGGIHGYWERGGVCTVGGVVHQVQSLLPAISYYCMEIQNITS